MNRQRGHQQNNAYHNKGRGRHFDNSYNEAHTSQKYEQGTHSGWDRNNHNQTHTSRKYEQRTLSDWDRSTPNQAHTSRKHDQWTHSETNWKCQKCHCSNFSNRTYCYKCGNSKDSRPCTYVPVQWNREAGTGWNEDEDKYRKKDTDTSNYEPPVEQLIDWDSVYEANDKFEAERWAHLPPLQKTLYIEDPEVKLMSEKEVQDFRFVNVQGSWHCYRRKTLAFILPALLHIVAQPTPRLERVGPTCLVLAPTRELAQQIEREVLNYQYKNIQCVCIYGQGDKHQQIRKINTKSEIVIATPGRLNDFAEKGKIATWPEGVRDLAQSLLKDPMHVVVGSLDLQAVHTVTQHVVFCTEDEKRNELLRFIRSMSKDEKAIVFVGKKVTVDYLSVEMLENGLCVQSMHGDRDQCDREQALNDLKTGRVKVLIATDVAARGIDVTDVTHILNYDCPRDMEEYVHRVGRTGRAGRIGIAYTLVTREDWRNAGKLVNILEKSNQEVHPELHRMKERWEKAKAEKGLRERTGRFGNKAFQNYKKF
nr:probable ATP-dependent RNA helicase DDX43 [Cherax quadricarinatus]